MLAEEEEVVILAQVALDKPVVGMVIVREPQQQHQLIQEVVVEEEIHQM